MSFKGFPEDAFRFFKQLRIGKNNNREWYQANKYRYQEQVVAPAAALSSALHEAGLAKKVGLDSSAKNPLFRLHRDTRFSNDKTVLKTATGAVWSRSGLRKDIGSLYFHLEPGDCYVCAGFWEPDPALLRRMRLGLVEEPAAFAKTLAALKRGRIELYAEDPMKRLPRGFETYAGSAHEPHLKLRHFLALEAIPDRDVARGVLVDKILTFAKRSKPLLDWGWRHLDQWRREGGDEVHQERLLGRTKERGLSAQF